MATEVRVELPQTLADWPAKELGRLAGPWAHLARGLAHVVNMSNTPL
jgi:hypothetical protein